MTNAITRGEAVIRLRLDTSGAESDLQRFVSKAQGASVSMGSSFSRALGGDFLAGAAGSALRFGAGAVGVAAAAFAAPGLADIARGFTTPFAVAGQQVSEQLGFGAMARSAGIVPGAINQTVADVGLAGAFMDPASIELVYRMRKAMAEMYVRSENAVRQHPAIADDAQQAAAEAVQNFVNTMAEAARSFWEHLKATPGRISDIVANSR